MILENFSIGEFFGVIFIFPLFIWLALVFYDGLGIFKDVFYTSGRSPRFRRKK